MGRSEDLFSRAKDVLVGGVNSPVRAFKAVGGTPRFIESARGATIRDVEGREYVDYVGAWGANILGAAPAAVVGAVQRAAANGLLFGAPTEAEVRLAEEVRRRMPSVERLRLVNSGTEATMSALRLARAFTGRRKFLKFDGSYHGHADPFLSNAESGLATLGLAASVGVSDAMAGESVVAAYNSLTAVEAAFHRYGGELAAVIVEPVASNMGVVPPAPGFLETLRGLCDHHGVLLIFDEVVTGFRVSHGGAQELYRIRPDLTCLGKILGGGLPVGAYGGRADVMRLVAPEGPVYQAGTMSGNPITVQAGLATLGQLAPDVYEALDRISATLGRRLEEAAAAGGTPLQVNRVASMLTPFLAPRPVLDYASAKRTDAARFAHVFHGLLERGVYVPPSPFEAWFVSVVHHAQHVDQTVAAFEAALGPRSEPARGVPIRAPRRV